MDSKKFSKYKHVLPSIWVKVTIEVTNSMVKRNLTIKKQEAGLNRSMP